jgi:hypothetical protein
MALRFPRLLLLPKDHPDDEPPQARGKLPIPAGIEANFPPRNYHGPDNTPDHDGRTFHRMADFFADRHFNRAGIPPFQAAPTAFASKHRS